MKAINGDIFISDGTWFDAGTECKLDTACGQMGGIFHGIRTKEFNSECGGVEIGEKYEDGELCMWEEFGYKYDKDSGLRKMTAEEQKEWDESDD